MYDEVLQLFLVSKRVLVRHLIVSLKIFSSLARPYFTNFFHNMQWRDVRHLLGHSHPGLSYKEHVSCQWLFWHLVKQCLIVDGAELCQLLWEALFVSFCCLFIFLLLLFWQLLPLLRYHSHHFCNFDAGILAWNNSSLLVPEEHVRRLWLFNRNVLRRIQGSIKLRQVSEIDSNLAVSVHYWTETVLVRLFLIVYLWEVVS